MTLCADTKEPIMWLSMLLSVLHVRIYVYVTHPIVNFAGDKHDAHHTTYTLYTTTMHMLCGCLRI